MKEDYKKIVDKIEKARASGDMKALRRWRNKLERWQIKYGAYAPVI